MPFDSIRWLYFNFFPCLCSFIDFIFEIFQIFFFICQEILNLCFLILIILNSHSMPFNFHFFVVYLFLYWYYFLFLSFSFLYHILVVSYGIFQIADLGDVQFYLCIQNAVCFLSCIIHLSFGCFNFLFLVSQCCRLLFSLRLLFL